MNAILHLHPEKAIKVPVSYIHGAQFKPWAVNIRQQLKKEGVRVYASLEHGVITIFKR